MLEHINWTIVTIIVATMAIGHDLNSQARRICALLESINDQLLELNTPDGEED